MPQSLHPKANLEVIKKQAKELLNAHKIKDSTCCQVLRALHRFTDKSDAEILESDLKLADAQYALAMNYGCNSWVDLRRKVGVNQTVGAKHGNRLIVEGNGQNRDSVALSLVSAAKALGWTLDYADVTCRLGNAFGPGINTHETCTSHMQVEGRLLDRGLPSVGKQLGLSVERLMFPDLPGESSSEEMLLEHRRTAARILSPLLDDETVILVSGGWQVFNGPHGFRHWGYAGLLTSVNETEGFLLGAHPQGEIDNPLVSICQSGMEREIDGSGLYAFALKSSEQSFDDLAVLRLAVDRIRGIGIFRSDSRFLFGLAAMDYWIEIMRRDIGFCTPCWNRRSPDASGKPADAWENAMRLRQSSIDASKFLEGCSARLDNSSVSTHLASAINSYETIVDLLAGPILWDGRKSYQTILGDLKLQQDHADSVLVPARKSLSDAADHIELALSEITSG